MADEERTQEEIEEMLETFKGMEIDQSIYRVRGRTLDRYASAIGDDNPKYHGKKVEGKKKKDYSDIKPHPNFAAYSTIPGLFKLADLKDPKTGDKLIKNIGKLLHTGQFYDYSDCVDIPPGKKVYTSGVIDDLYIKAGWLWITLTLRTTDKAEDELYCKTTVTAAIREGGY